MESTSLAPISVELGDDAGLAHSAGSVPDFLVDRAPEESLFEHKFVKEILRELMQTIYW